MNSNRGGTSVIGIVVGLVVLAALVVGGLYMFSDVFHTKFNSAYNDFSKWTPENIAKDPVNYLNFCEEQTKAAQFKLKASEIAIGQKKSQFSSKCEEGQKVVDAGTKALDELKAAYKKADADNSFPVTWENAQWDKVACQKQIVKLNSDIISRQELIKKYQQAVTLLDNQKAKVDEAQSQAKEQLAKIDTNREMLKVQAITDDLKGQLVSMKGVLQTSVLDVASSDAGPMNLDEVAGKSAPAFDQGQFDKIMAK